jgi:glycosyltransferase involved in cell wall biosynthesis
VVEGASQLASAPDRGRDPESKTPMVVWAGTWLPYSQTFIYEQLLAERRFESTVFCHRYAGNHDKLFPHPRVRTLPMYEWPTYLSMRVSPTYTRALRELKPAILHAHFGFHGVHAAGFAKREKVPLIVSFHGKDGAALTYEARRRIEFLPYRNWLAPAMFRTAQRYLPVSNDQADLLISAGVDVRKIHVHNLGIPLDRFEVEDRPDGPLRVLMVGRFVEKKGMEYGIRAMGRIRSEFPDARMKIIGSGFLEKRLKRIVFDLDLEDIVEFLGVVPPDRVADEMKAASVMLCPSVVSPWGDREGGLTVCKEASATGLPVVSTFHGGIPHVIEHGRTGILVPERQVTPIVDALWELARSKKLRDELGLEGRRKMEREFDSRIQSDRLEAHFQDVIDGR